MSDMPSWMPHRSISLYRLVPCLPKPAEAVYPLGSVSVQYFLTRSCALPRLKEFPCELYREFTLDLWLHSFFWRGVPKLNSRTVARLRNSFFQRLVSTR